MRFVRRIVSKNKVRFQKDGFDLDLAYITNRIVAMGCPSEGSETLFRNPLSETLAFLDKYHEPSRRRVYNLCSERSYDPVKLRCAVVRFACHDKQPPALSVMRTFCEDASNWLDADPDNAVIVHCKAGKGRTGVLICCLLMWTGVVDGPEEAIAFYGAKRTRNGRGVTIASQVRYVQYFHQMFMQSGGVDRPLKAPEGSEMEKTGCTDWQPVRSPTGMRKVRLRELRVSGLPESTASGATVKVSHRRLGDSTSESVFAASARSRGGVGGWTASGAAGGGEGDDFTARAMAGELVVVSMDDDEPSRSRDENDDGDDADDDADADAGDVEEEEELLAAAEKDDVDDDDDETETDSDTDDLTEADTDDGWRSKAGEKELPSAANDSDSAADRARSAGACGGCCCGGGGGGAARHVFDWDIQVQVLSPSTPVMPLPRQTLFQAWCNTSFLPETGIVTLGRQDLDHVHGRLKEPVLELRFEDASSDDDDSDDDDSRHRLRHRHQCADDGGDDDDAMTTCWSCVDGSSRAASELIDASMSGRSVSTSCSTMTTAAMMMMTSGSGSNNGADNGCSFPRPSALRLPGWRPGGCGGRGQCECVQDSARSTAMAEDSLGTFESWDSIEAAWSKGWGGVPDDAAVAAAAAAAAADADADADADAADAVAKQL